MNFRTLRTVSLGVALAEDTKNILVSDGFIDTVTGNPLGQGVAMVWGRRHRVLRNVIANCLTAAFWHVEAGAFSVDNERNTIKDNIIYNCGVVYRVETVAMPTGRLNQMIGPNTVFINTLTAYSNIDTVNRTQAEFEATYPTAIDASDVLVLDQPSTLYRYSEQQALNILAGNTTPPYTQYSKQQALNRIVGNTTGNPNKYGSQFVTNALIGNN